MTTKRNQFIGSPAATGTPRLQRLQPGTVTRLPDGTTAICRALVQPWSKSPCCKCFLHDTGSTDDVPVCFPLCNARQRPDRCSVYFEKIGT